MYFANRECSFFIYHFVGKFQCVTERNDRDLTVDRFLAFRLLKR